MGEHSATMSPLRVSPFVPAVLVMTVLAGTASAVSVLLVAGPKSHGPGQHEHPAGCELLASHLASAGLDLRTEVSIGWPQDPAKVASADTLVIYGDGKEAHPAKGQLAALKQRVAAGKGLVVLHWALEPTDAEMAAFLTEAIAGRFETDWSVNPIWTMEGPLLGEHPVTRGVKPFAIEEEFYFHMRLRGDAVPVLRALPPESALGPDGPYSGNPHVRKALAAKEPQTLAWAVENTSGARGFGFTGGHFHRNWSQADFLKLVLNGITWTAKVEVPADGVQGKVAAAPANPTIDVAIARGDLADVKLHVAANPDSLRKGGAPNARPPLDQAILRNKTEIALFLIESGADPYTVGAGQRTPLHLAIERNNPVVVKALLKAGAKPNVGDQDGWTPLHHAAAKDQVENAKVLLDGGADPMTLSALGGTPLHEAGASGGAEMIRLLLEHKVDPKLKSKEGVTALDVARKYKNEAAIGVLEGR